MYDNGRKIYYDVCRSSDPVRNWFRWDFESSRWEDKHHDSIFAVRAVGHDFQTHIYISLRARRSTRDVTQNTFTISQFKNNVHPPPLIQELSQTRQSVDFHQSKLRRRIRRVCWSNDRKILNLSTFEKEDTELLSRRIINWSLQVANLKNQSSVKYSSIRTYTTYYFYDYYAYLIYSIRSEWMKITSNMNKKCFVWIRRSEYWFYSGSHRDSHIWSYLSFNDFEEILIDT